MLKKLGKQTWSALDAVGQQANGLANKMGAEAFWPMPLDKECEKAAAILCAFTKEGVRAADTSSSATAGRSNINPPQRAGNNTKAIMQIPPKVIASAKGLAIFTVFRTGFHISGSGGAGILIARLPDGSWGPPSGIVMHVVGIGLLVGIDVYDTVLVLRTPAAVNAFAHPKVSLGAELSVAAGPVGQGGAIDVGVTDGSPAWVYTKSKGFYAGIAMDGTIVVQRSDENERFYGRKIGAGELIKGAVKRPPSTDGLVRMIEMAEGKRGPEQGGWVQAPPEGWSPIPVASPVSEQQKQDRPFSTTPPPLPSRPSYAPPGGYPPGGYPSGGYPIGSYPPPAGPPGPPRGSSSYSTDSSPQTPTYGAPPFSPPPAGPPARDLDEHGYPIDRKTPYPEPNNDAGDSSAPSRVPSQTQGASSSSSMHPLPPSTRQDSIVESADSPYADQPPAYTEEEEEQPEITLSDGRRH